MNLDTVHVVQRFHHGPKSLPRLYLFCNENNREFSMHGPPSLRMSSHLHGLQLVYFEVHM